MLADKVPFEAAHYRGGAPMMADLITGRVDFSWPTLSTSRAYLADGKLRALALDADARWDRLPDVPTLDELGFGKEKVASWFALAAPAGTPPAIVSKLNELFIKASQDPELKRRLEENGTPILTNTPAQMGQAMEQEWQTMQQLAKTLNLRIQSRRDNSRLACSSQAGSPLPRGRTGIGGGLSAVRPRGSGDPEHHIRHAD